MMRKGVSCRVCVMSSLDPHEAKPPFCPACEGSTMIQRNYSGRLPYGKANSMSSSTYVTNNPGFAGYNGPCGKSYQPVNTGRVYQIHAQPHAPPAHGHKRAVLCGINYDDLEGCINDVMNMRRLLVERFGFPVSSILVLTEEQDYSHVPTKKNIRAALRWLVHGCESGDSLVFHYSGHGKQVEDLDGDELDGNDECIMPVDYKTKGVILDDEINETIVRPLPRGATLHATFDSCNSGTVLDLPCVYNVTKGRWDDNRAPSGAYKGSMGGRAICFSACDDDQLAKDTSPTSPSGAMTTAFIRAIEAAFNINEKISYQFILDYMHQTLMQAHKSGHHPVGIHRMFDRRNLQVLSISFTKINLCQNNKNNILTLSGMLIFFPRFQNKCAYIYGIQSWLTHTERCTSLFYKLFKLKTVLDYSLNLVIGSRIYRSLYNASNSSFVYNSDVFIPTCSGSTVISFRRIQNQQRVQAVVNAELNSNEKEFERLSLFIFLIIIVIGLLI